MLVGILGTVQPTYAGYQTWLCRSTSIGYAFKPLEKSMRFNHNPAASLADATKRHCLLENIARSGPMIGIYS